MSDHLSPSPSGSAHGLVGSWTPCPIDTTDITTAAGLRADRDTTTTAWRAATDAALLRTCPPPTPEAAHRDETAPATCTGAEAQLGKAANGRKVAARRLTTPRQEWWLSGADLHNHSFISHGGYIPKVFREAWLRFQLADDDRAGKVGPYECIQAECGAAVPVAMKLPAQSTAGVCRLCRCISEHRISTSTEATIVLGATVSQRTGRRNGSTSTEPTPPSDRPNAPRPNGRTVPRATGRKQAVHRPDTPHGKTRYAAGCRCQTCVTSQRAISKEYRRQKRAEAIPAYVHGTSNGYTNYGCRCEPCKTAASEYRKQWDEARRKLNQP